MRKNISVHSSVTCHQQISRTKPKMHATFGVVLIFSSLLFYCRNMLDYCPWIRMIDEKSFCNKNWVSSLVRDSLYASCFVTCTDLLHRTFNIWLDDGKMTIRIRFHRKYFSLGLHIQIISDISNIMQSIYNSIILYGLAGCRCVISWKISLNLEMDVLLAWKLRNILHFRSRSWSSTYARHSISVSYFANKFHEKCA